MRATCLAVVQMIKISATSWMVSWQQKANHWGLNWTELNFQREMENVSGNHNQLDSRGQNGVSLQSSGHLCFGPHSMCVLPERRRPYCRIPWSASGWRRALVLSLGDSPTTGARNGTRTKNACWMPCSVPSRPSPSSTVPVTVLVHADVGKGGVQEHFD